MNKIEKMLTVAEVADIFGVKPLTIRTWLKEERLRGIKIGSGHYWRIPESAVIELANRKYGAEDAT